MKMVIQSNSGYAEEAPELLKRYEEFSFETEQSSVIAYFPPAPASVVDIGAGTGRDAAYFADNGYKVVAVEPTTEMRKGAMALHPSPDIQWLDDRLPELELLRSRSETFDIVMLNAVWMHLNAEQRKQGLASIAKLVHAGSRVFIKLRHGPVPTGRLMYDVSGEETIRLSSPYGFTSLHCEPSLSSQAVNKASGVTWTDLVLEKS